MIKKEEKKKGGKKKGRGDEEEGGGGEEEDKDDGKRIRRRRRGFRIKALPPLLSLLLKKWQLGHRVLVHPPSTTMCACYTTQFEIYADYRCPLKESWVS